MPLDQNLQNFIQSQKLLTLGTVGKDGKPWLSNVFYSSDTNLNFEFA